MSYFHLKAVLAVLTVFLCALVPVLATANTNDVPLEEWQIEVGDRFIVDTKKNVGYLVHENGGYTSFLVVTGQRRIVHYLGRSYNATTPERHWTVFSDERKGRSVTFGEDGTFLRLFYKGESTPYGIHSHLYAKTMLARDDRFGSMGCVILSEEVLDLVEATFLTNGEKLDVVTVYGFAEEVVSDRTLRAVLDARM